MKKDKLKSALEALLFAADQPVSAARFQEVFGEDGPTKIDIQEAMEELKDKFADDSFGIEIREAQGGYQFCTKVENGEFVRRFLANKPFRLSKSALETLAIIAYRQPITRAEIDNVRGIDCSHLMRTLIEKGIVKMMGKADIPGRPVQYGTTEKFLDLIGLNSIKDLPPLSELKELQGDQPEDEKDPIEEGLGRFVDNEITLEKRQQELEEGLGEIDEVIKSAGDPKREIFESEEERAVAEANLEALSEFQTTSRGWARARKKAASEAKAEAAREAEEAVPEVEGAVIEEAAQADQPANLDA